ncbi:type VII secretion-associated protein [Rhodococcus antarcticus]|uniref:Type VII secretion-associated protein n=1 Tax=Rhodococcus antarcticus TaxID=2987751 RepID=A0ABY6P122_9NOCA|nr:type VII secretion-associated protein [Rhodococcus antarcticus]UZJ25360.1 type VII secretion-associated protein [Rhodococcus antarcticus]
MTVRVAVDLGTSSTCVAIAVDGAEPRVVVVDGSPLMSSAVWADGRGVFVGAEAERQASIDPARFEPHPKRRVDEGSLLLGDTVLGVQQALAAVLRRAVAEARAVLGGAAVDELVLTHPADWGGVRTGVLVAAAGGLAARTLLVPEPVAAAVQHAAGVAPGTLLAVLDVGGGTTDVTVLRRTATGFTVLATRGDPGFGGVDVDQALLEHLGSGLVGEQRSEWDAVVLGRGLEQRRRRRILTADLRGAKETLSRHAYADVALPGALPDAHVTRDDLERLVGPRVAAVVDLLGAALADVRALDAQGRSTAAVHLVGGSSRIPLVSRLVHARLGVLAVSTDQPETVVARGALLAVRPPPPHPGPTAAPAVTQPDPTAPVPTGRRRGRLLRLGGPLLLVAVAVVVAVVLLTRDPQTRTVQAQHATVVVPDTWREAARSEDGATARLVLSATGSSADPRRLLLVQTRLSGGAGAAEVASALREQVAGAAAPGAGTGSAYDSFDDGAEYAGRAVIRYREVPDPGSAVDWFVVVEGGYQLSVGCQHPAADAGPDGGAGTCERAVGSVQVSGG